MNWINVEDKPIDFSNVSFIRTQDGKIVHFKNEVSIFEHGERLYELLTATHWMPLPEPPKFQEEK